MSFSSVNASNVFIDIATFSELEGFIYGGPDAITWFVAAVQKANWMSFIPITLRCIGNTCFGAKCASASVNRSGDYVLNIWFRCQIPQIELRQDGVVDVLGSGIYTNAQVRWTRNLMHNLFEKVNITFNELVVHEFDSFWMDFNFQFRKRGSKRIGYRNMIGDISAMTDWHGPTDNAVGGQKIPVGTGGYFSVPFPFWFGEDSGIALPVAALPFNDIKVNYHFRRLEELLVVYPGTREVGGVNGIGSEARIAQVSDIFVFGSTTQKPTLIDAQTNSHYAVVHNDERVKMGDAPRDCLIHQVQSTQCNHFKDISSRSCFDIRLSHAIVLFCFAAQNVSIALVNGGGSGAEWSNYTTEPNYAGLDPISYTTLIYESTTRLAQGSDYYSMIHPDLFSEATPDETGYHMWSYSLKPWDPLKPAGSTNYSKLANVSISHDASPAALASVGINTASGAPETKNGSPLVWPNMNGVEVPFAQKYRHVFQARNWNIARVANGSLGHPTL